MTFFWHSLYFFIKHCLLEIDEHSLHSPFLYNLYDRIIKPAKQISGNNDIEDLRKMYLSDKRKIPGNNRGAGSRVTRPEHQNLRHAARYSFTPLKYSWLMVSLIRYFGCKSIIELGTSLGINALYLSRSSGDSSVYTLEGNKFLTELARENFRRMGATNIKLIEGDIDQQLPVLLSRDFPVDFAYLDANHTYESTIKYFRLLRKRFSACSTVVIDDIYWSPGMTRAWQQICSQNANMLFIDLYRCGIVIYKENIPAGYYRLAF